MSQEDIQTELTKPDAIGMGSYNSDSHNVQRRPDADGIAMENEGDMQVKVAPYQIPYRVMLPKRAEASNLLVPVCFSATHVAYSTLRMEPQYMILGHAAGVAAKMAIAGSVPVQDIDTAALRSRLEVGACGARRQASCRNEVALRRNAGTRNPEPRTRNPEPRDPELDLVFRVRAALELCEDELAVVAELLLASRSRSCSSR